MRSRVPLFILSLLVLLALATPAQSQIRECGTCDPYYGSCSEPCWYCNPPSYDYCPQYSYFETTCGDYMGACIPDNCATNFQESERVNVGTYGETTYGAYCQWFPFQCWPRFGCKHHRVDRVTEHDQNECNISPYYHDVVYCDDYVDFEIPAEQENIPNCCSFLYGMSCNDWHSCW